MKLKIARLVMKVSGHGPGQQKVKMDKSGEIILHNALPTASSLVLKGLPIDPTCIFCGCASEFVAHIFRGCQFIQLIWGMVPWGSLPVPVDYIPFQSWFAGTIMQSAASKNWTYLDKLFGLCWAIWLTRNGARFRLEVYSPYTIIDLASSWSTLSEKARQLDNVLVSSPPGFSPCPRAFILQGAPSEIYDVLFFCDGAWDSGSSCAGAGWCFQDPISSQVLGGGARACMASSALHSELLACLWGLQHVRQKGFTKVRIFSDYLAMIQLLSASSTVEILVTWIVDEIRCILSSFVACSIYKVSRSSVDEAHSLAVAARCRELLFNVF
ncbi:uncharacterized protein LOC110738949 [Chenopodium quinoa]|uniref:uncharacterized protein LOC110738949 n=1 Tax=Chenopodium quinoa TaxID=63459 RepID=UPI000B7988B5|nr:uncharacterized protein LOC110738949 [Chenopodium quinoa]